MSLVQNPISGLSHKAGIKALALRILHAQPSHGNGRNDNARAFRQGYEAARKHFLAIADSMIKAEPEQE